MLGAASAVIPPTLAALSLGIVGRRLMPDRISRNEIFNHAGTFLAAGRAGSLGHFLGNDWIFYLVCVFAIASAAVVLLIDPAEIDHDAARGSEDSEHDCEPIPIRELLARRPILVFIATIILFNVGNAAMLPFAGQVLGRAHPNQATLALSACIIVAQLVMVGVSWAVGRAMRRGIGRKPIFLVALCTLPVRGVLFSFVSDPYGVVAIQILDGLGAGIVGVIAIVIASDLTRGTGRFNLMQGVVALATGAGASLSKIAGGYVVQVFEYPVGFLSLAAVAVCSLIFFLLLMPETSS